MIAQVEMRQCITCRQYLPVAAFYVRKKYKYSRCKQCMIKRGSVNRKNLRKNRAKIKNTYKQCGCPLCFEKQICCMSFHHINKHTKFIINKVKVYNPFYARSMISKRTATNDSGQGHTRLINEILKCIVLCENCHRKLHAGIITLSELDMQKIQFVQLYQFLQSYTE